jgi:O-antigen/teichoic acid export membrane protein
MQTNTPLKKQAIHVFTGRSISFIVTFFVPLILVRIFTENDYGVYRQILLVSTSIAGILSLNITNSLYYFLPLKNTQNEKSGILSQTYLLILIISLLFIASSFFINDIIEKRVGNIVSTTIILAIICHIVFSLLSGPLDNLFVIESKTKIAMFYYAFDKIFRMIIVLIALLFFGRVVTVVWFLVGYLFMKAMFLFIYLIKNYDISFKKLKIENIKSQLNYIIPLGFSLIVGTIGKYADQFILMAFFTTADFALYSVGKFNIPMIAML